MRITIPTSRAMVPAVAPKKLEPDQATLARDCVLGSGELRPLGANQHVWNATKPGVIRTIYRFARQFWFHWASDVDVVRTLVPGDTMETTFWTGDGAPRYTRAGAATSGGGTNYPSNSWQLGVAAPASAPSAADITPAPSPGGDGSIIEPEKETRFYVYTMVNSEGWESAPSPVSSRVVCPVDGTVHVSGMQTPSAMGQVFTSKRIYRISTGTDASEFLFVAEVPVSATTFDDNVSGFLLGEVLSTEGWIPPPDNLQGLIALPNGVFAGFVGKDLYLTPPYAPYAWPMAHRVSTEYSIVALGAVGTNIIIMTEGHPYIATGIDPSAVTLAKLEISQACVSKRGVASFGAYGVVYPSPDGLVAVDSSGPSIITEGLMTEREWREYNPSSFVAAAHDGAYIAFYEKTDGQRGGLWFHPTFGFTELGFHATAAWTDLLTDTLFVVVDRQIFAFDKGDPTPYIWRSKVFQTAPTSFTSARVTGSFPGTATLTVHADGEELYTIAVPGPDAFRLPPALGGKREWQVEVSGTLRIQEIDLASSMGEFR